MFTQSFLRVHKRKTTPSFWESPWFGGLLLTLVTRASRVFSCVHYEPNRDTVKRDTKVEHFICVLSTCHQLPCFSFRSRNSVIRTNRNGRPSLILITISPYRHRLRRLRRSSTSFLCNSSISITVSLPPPVIVFSFSLFIIGRWYDY